MNKSYSCYSKPVMCTWAAQIWRHNISCDTWLCVVLYFTCTAEYFTLYIPFSDFFVVNHNDGCRQYNRLFQSRGWFTCKKHATWVVTTSTVSTFALITCMDFTCPLLSDVSAIIYHSDRLFLVIFILFRYTIYNVNIT